MKIKVRVTDVIPDKDHPVIVCRLIDESDGREITYVSLDKLQNFFERHKDRYECINLTTDRFGLPRVLP